jgi:predicted transcriptional regulator
MQEKVMTTIKIDLPKERVRKLRELAAHYGVSPEELVRVSVEDMLKKPEEQFQEAVDYVLKKNDELYRRLAA